MNTITKDTKRIFHPALNTNAYLHCQCVNIILTPEDATIQSCNKRNRCPHKMSNFAAPGGAPQAKQLNILHPSPLSKRKYQTSNLHFAKDV